MLTCPIQPSRMSNTTVAHVKRLRRINRYAYKTRVVMIATASAVPKLHHFFYLFPHNNLQYNNSYGIITILKLGGKLYHDMP
jgi:hypothetical protein